ncbi:hypothetical protein CROQUDRAFT_51571 [Cronartium quercuum f. sp. fusiforme G11]|uniref:Cytochrome b5 heme-binding domain-containing protein n=1 Tax=Cronartium quercuum f. sp. fusiforme G11 TaxID=708437 RepID=A0A9P6N905_9BASI|nr:hypothetical protein CROQUDRAFT_51571 [Cronartium quercuum f. sp. fusiforme G11]
MPLRTLTLQNYSSARAHQPSMVMNYTRTHLIELNGRSDDSCLVVISGKVYDLTLWLDEQEDSLGADELRTLAGTDPVDAGRTLANRLGRNVEARIAECRIGDFDPFELAPESAPPACVDPGGHSALSTLSSTQEWMTGHQHESVYSDPHSVSLGVCKQSSSNTLTYHGAQAPTIPALAHPPQRPSHLARALALVEHHKQLVIEAETKVGTAHVSLAEAFEGLAEAEKKRDHLVMLACEGFRPTLPEWEEVAEEDMV